MDTQQLHVKSAVPTLEFDLIGDLVCPWSFLGKRSLERALQSLYGFPARVLRWHGLPLAGDRRPTWREHFASRLPPGTTLDAMQKSLRASGTELGIDFAFERLGALPDTHEAHRLVRLAARDGRQGEVIDLLFSAYFEHGRDIADTAVLSEITREAQLEPATCAAFADPGEARGDVAADEQRMRGLGIAVVPNLLINGRVLVPGPADVPTYLQALDQALFPELKAARNRRRLH
ncbi:MAG TPA: DsbA family oxidoreductase [Steroidobacteraceae bacterium]|nr:DsbA family oxidoreductase [Steroidobacteraceae bacterium]